MIRQEMLTYVKEKKPIIDGHIHTLNERCVPDGFLGVRLPFNPVFFGFLKGSTDVLSHVLPMKAQREYMANLESFVTQFKNQTQLANLEKKLSYEKNSIEVVLQMDMTVSIKGKQDLSQEQQMIEMKAMKDKYPHRVLLFVALDPNNPDCKKNFALAMEKYDFDGVKVYPSLGYLPTHPVLMEILAICEQKGIPVVSHCSSVCMKNKNKKLRIVGEELDKTGKIVIVDKVISVKKKEDLQFLNHPKNWLPVMMAYPKLYLNLAHFYGVEWNLFLAGKKSGVTDIIDMMRVYENFRTDCSYTLYRPEFVVKLKQMMQENEIIRNKVLYGTDWFMTLQEGSFRDIITRFKMTMGDDLMNQMIDNNIKFYIHS